MAEQPRTIEELLSNARSGFNGIQSNVFEQTLTPFVNIIKQLLQENNQLKQELSLLKPKEEKPEDTKPQVKKNKK